MTYTGWRMGMTAKLRVILPDLTSALFEDEHEWADVLDRLEKLRTEVAATTPSESTPLLPIVQDPMDGTIISRGIGSSAVRRSL